MTEEKQLPVLPLKTEVEVVKLEGGKAIAAKTMTYEQALSFKRTKGFFYRIFQKGFSQFKIEK